MATSSPTSSPAVSVLSGLGGVRGWAGDFYRDLHTHPELSHQEHATASKVAERLGDSGIEVHAGVGGTGVVGVVRNGDGPTQPFTYLGGVRVARVTLGRVRT